MAQRPPTGPKPHQLRKAGQLPMALISRDHQIIPLQVAVGEMREAVQNLDAHGALTFQVLGEVGARKALLSQVDLDPLRKEVLHVTLSEVADNDEIRADIPIRVIGSPRDDQGEGTLSQTMTHLKVKGRHRDIPDHFEVNVDGLELGSHIEIRQLGLPESITSLTPVETAVVIYMRTPSEVSEEAEAKTEA